MKNKTLFPIKKFFTDIRRLRCKEDLDQLEDFVSLSEVEQVIRIYEEELISKYNLLLKGKEFLKKYL